MTIRYRFILLVFFIASPCGNPPIYAQESSFNADSRYYWADVGIGGAWVYEGIGSPTDKSGFSIGLGLYYRKGNELFSLRITGTVEPRMHLWGNQPDESISEYGVLYGRVTKSILRRCIRFRRYQHCGCIALYFVYNRRDSVRSAAHLDTD